MLPLFAVDREKFRVFNPDTSTKNFGFGVGICIINTGNFEMEEMKMRKTIIDDAAADELALYTENTSQVYNNATMPTIRNLEKKFKKGNYNKDKAVKAWEYVAEYAAKLYHKEFGGGCRWFDAFNKATRQAVAEHLESVYFDEYINV